MCPPGRRPILELSSDGGRDALSGFCRKSEVPSDFRDSFREEYHHSPGPEEEEIKLVMSEGEEFSLEEEKSIN